MIDYYKTCAVAKPVDKKKKKLMNGYKDKPNRICGSVGPDMRKDTRSLAERTVSTVSKTNYRLISVKNVTIGGIVGQMLKP